MYCPSCHSKMYETEKYCPICGKLYEKRVIKSGWLTIILLAVVAAVLAGCYMKYGSVEVLSQRIHMAFQVYYENIMSGFGG